MRTREIDIAIALDCKWKERSVHLSSFGRRRSTRGSLTAVILVGGQGMRLRPLTERMPKPLLPLLGRPLLAYTFDQLRGSGVERAVLACGYLPTAIRAQFGDRFDGLALEYRVEPEPLGTGGALRYAADCIDGTFLALNGDSVREVDVARLITFHRRRRAKATILLTSVAEPGRYGLVRTDTAGRVTEFLEKPQPAEIDTNLINAGLYVLEPEVLDYIEEGKSVSLERDIFPRLAAEGSLYALHVPGYWIDIGTPESYLQAHLDLLQRGETRIDDSARVSPTASLIPPLIIERGVSIGAGARIGPLVHLGSMVEIGREASIGRSAVLPGAVVGPGVTIGGAIVAPEYGALTP